MHKLIEHRVLIVTSLVTLLEAGLLTLHRTYGIGIALFIGALFGTALMLRPPRARIGQVLATVIVDGIVIAVAWKWASVSPEALLFGVVACSFTTVRLSPKLGLASFGLLLIGTGIPLYRASNGANYILITTILSVSCVLILQIAEVSDKFRQYRRLSIYDDLTHLHNMRYFRYKMAQFFRDPQITHVCLCVIDLDEFKVVNDTLGHSVGDRVLERAAQVMNEAARPWVLCRYGGEEFVLTLPNASLTEAVEVAERIQSALAASQLCALRVTLSCGIARVDVAMGSPDTLFDQADRALYIAKQTKNSVQVYQAGPAEAEIAASPEGDLSK